MRILVLIVSLLVCQVAAAADWGVTLEEWARPRDGAMLLGLPGVHAAVTAWRKDPAQRLVIRYPGGEEGALWAQELRAWLVSLGIASRHIELWPGSSREDAIDLEVNP